jgi:hypothetical protein
MKKPLVKVNCGTCGHPVEWHKPLMSDVSAYLEPIGPSTPGWVHQLDEDHRARPVFSSDLRLAFL